MVMVWLFNSLAQEYRGQVSKDKRLYCRYKQLQEEHEYAKG